MTTLSREDLKERLKYSDAPVFVKFTKIDGTVREMQCTLDGTKIPLSDHPKGTSTAKENTDTLRVYDVVNNGWRSFRMDSILEVK